MPATRKRRNKHGGKKHSVPPPSATTQSSSSSSSSSPLEAFFATYASKFQYDSTASASLEFYRLCDESGWDKDNPNRQTAHQKFKDALVQQFNDIYGTDVNNIKNWQSLCRVVRIDPIPDGLHACREAVYYTFVNLVDLVDTKTTGDRVDVFESEKALSEYTISTGKYFPRENAYEGGVLRYLLRNILRPRDGYDASHRGGKFKFGGRGRARKRQRRNSVSLGDLV